MKAKGCVLADMVLAFKLLQACNLSDIETNLVLTGINFDLGRSTENMLQQTKESVKKFIGRTKIVEEKKEQVVKSENTYVTKEELTLMLQKVQKKRFRTRSKSQDDHPQESAAGSSNYKGKKNPLGKDAIVRIIVPVHADTI